MNLTREYYLRTYDELSILSNTEKCVTVLMRNRDTGELVVKKTMHKSSFEVYSKLKEIDPEIIRENQSSLGYFIRMHRNNSEENTSN